MTTVQFGMLVFMLVLQFAFISYHLANMAREISYIATKIQLMPINNKEAK